MLLVTSGYLAAIRQERVPTPTLIFTLTFAVLASPTEMPFRYL